MQLRLRTKLLGIVGTTALAFLVLLVASYLLKQSAARETGEIRDRYLPRLELGPKIEAGIERLRRGLQDAVAASDAEALAATRETAARLREQLAAARGALDATQIDALQRALDEYYAAA